MYLVSCHLSWTQLRKDIFKYNIEASNVDKKMFHMSQSAVYFGLVSTQDTRVYLACKGDFLGS